MNILTWNIARRKSRATSQVEYVVEQSVDVVALQEVTPAYLAIVQPLLRDAGFEYQAHSLPSTNDGRSNRSYGVLLASKSGLTDCDQARIPWQEKALTRLIDSPKGKIVFTTAYIPPGSSNGWIKIDTIEGVVAHKLAFKGRLRILCGDFNCPKSESTDGEIVTWAQVESEGGTRTKKRIRGGDGNRWDAAERSLFTTLAEDGMNDVFRRVHGFKRQASSWHLMNRGREFPRRFDHCFSNIAAISCDYGHEPRIAGLSDHAPLITRFRI
ncbi:MAG TPA: hypothetical protein EYQ00_10555 [Dehalococcoidia bacterium]|nr:hypothetical protein [Dehalococcoidia bacterium]HIL96932.1 hypothetical protein [Pseudomonadales bacterium]